MIGPLEGEFAGLAWDQVSYLARSAAGLFVSREGRLGTAANMAQAILRSHEGGPGLHPSTFDDIRWVAAGGDPLDPTDGFLGGRPSTRIIAGSPTLADLMTTLGGNPPGARSHV